MLPFIFSRMLSSRSCHTFSFALEVCKHDLSVFDNEAVIRENNVAFLTTLNVSLFHFSRNAEDKNLGRALRSLKMKYVI